MWLHFHQTFPQCSGKLTKSGGIINYYYGILGYVNAGLVPE